MFPATEWHGEGRDCEHVVCFPTVNGAQCADCRMIFRRALPQTPVPRARIMKVSQQYWDNLRYFARILGASHA